MALRQGMFATVRISSEPSEPTLLIPREAIIDTGTRQIVFISEGNGRFSPRNVRVGFTGDGGLVQILEGLKAGEMVVTSGQFLLDSESRLKEVLQKHLTDQLVVKPKEPAGEAVAVAHADEIVAEYLKISQALGAPQQSAEPIDVEPLVKLARQSAEHTQGEGKSLAADVTSAAEAMAGQPIDPQRELFVKLSAAVITLAERTKISSQVAPALYVVRCPMAFGTTADWLQATPEIANPFYATRMKSCGTIERTIETRTAE
jgi:Cu(I)/Ag(I) efflux system membrane fusion protein